ncbi:MAG: hypothetical protein Q4B48_06415, partial [Syntrophomonadaceae bacterium]|nr:hypothetical protein [Syntrophomonadaceae bacterium]
ERTERLEHIERMERVADMRHIERGGERRTGDTERQSRYNEFIERVLPGISAIQEWNVKLRTRLRIRDITWPHHLGGAAGTEAVSPGAWADELIAAGERREDAAMVLYRHEAVTGERTETLMRRQELASVLRERRQQQRVSKIFIDRTVRELLYHDRQALQTGRGILERTARLMSPALQETAASGGGEVTGGKTASYSPYGGQGASTIDRRIEKYPAEQGPKAAASAEPSEYEAPRPAGAEIAPPALSGSRQMLTMRQRLEGTMRFDYSARMPMLRLAAWAETMNQAARTAEEEELPALIAGDVVWRQPPAAEDIKSTTGRREQAAEQRPLSPQNRSAQEIVYQQEQTIRRLEAKVKEQGFQVEALLQQQSAAGELPEAEVAKLADKVMKRLSRELWMERQRRGMS